MPTLYEIADAREVLDRIIEEGEGELTPELEAALDENGAGFDEKLERCALWLKERLLDADAIKAEEDRLQKRRHAIVNATSSLREYMKRQMERMGKDQVRGVLVTVALRQNALRVDGTPSADVLRELFYSNVPFVKYQPEEFSIDRTKLNQYVRNGNLPPEGTAIAPTSTYITIR